MKHFVVETVGYTLIVIPQESVSSLAGNDIELELPRVLDEMQRRRSRHIVIDLGSTECFGSLMLALMLALSTRVGRDGGAMALCNVSAVGREVLQITRFDSLWPVCNSRSEALEQVEGSQR